MPRNFPQNTKEKLLRKIVKKDSYIKMLGDAFRQAIEINRESSFVEVQHQGDTMSRTPQK